MAAPSGERWAHLDVLAWEAFLASAAQARNGHALAYPALAAPVTAAPTCAPRSRPMCWPPCCGWPLYLAGQATDG